MRFVAVLLVLLAGIRPAPLRAQTALPPLSFIGFRAGLRLDTLERRVRALGGRGLRCKRARKDRAVSECRATVFRPGTGTALKLWLSAMDSTVGILTLSSDLDGPELDQWRSQLEHEFGEVGARVQGTQWMLQWVRHRQMLRLTWRIEQGRKTASVSLVDGRVLDTWGQRWWERWERRHPADSSAAPAGDSAAAGS